MIDSDIKTVDLHSYVYEIVFVTKEKPEGVKHTHTHTHTHVYMYGRWYLVTKSCLILSTPWTVAHQAPLSTGFPKQEYWSGLSFPSPIYMCCCSVTKSCPTLCGPMDAAHQASLSFTISQPWLKLKNICVKLKYICVPHTHILKLNGGGKTAEKYL